LLIQPCIAYHVDLIDGLYTLTQARVEEQGQVADWDLVLADFKGLDQSTEEPKASAKVEEGRSAYNLFGINSHLFLLSIYVMFCAFKFQELF
jgi:hypothetical protein